MTETARRRRWYDLKPELSRSVEIMTGLPPEIQTIVADGVIRMAEDDFRAGEIMNTFKSLGRDRILALFKSKSKQRGSDQNPVMHKALSYYYVLSDTDRTSLAKLILELMNHLYEYFKSCQELKVTPVGQDISRLTKAYAGNDRKNMAAHLDEIKEQLKNRPAAAATATENTETAFKIKESKPHDPSEPASEAISEAHGEQDLTPKFVPKDPGNPKKKDVKKKNVTNHNESYREKRSSMKIRDY